MKLLGKTPEDIMSDASIDSFEKLFKLINDRIKKSVN